MQAFHDPDLESDNACPELGIVKGLSRFDTSRDKVEIVVKSQDWVAITNSLLLCTSAGWFGYDYNNPQFMVDVTKAITGWDTTLEELMKTGERMNNLCRCFNAREGVTRKDDYLPPRFTEDKLIGGSAAGHRISKEVLNEMLDDYYDLRGWDKTTGLPTQAKLNELELGFAKLP